MSTCFDLYPLPDNSQCIGELKKFYKISCSDTKTPEPDDSIMSSSALSKSRCNLRTCTRNVRQCFPLASKPVRAFCCKDREGMLYINTDNEEWNFNSSTKNRFEVAWILRSSNLKVNEFPRPRDGYEDFPGSVQSDVIAADIDISLHNRPFVQAQAGVPMRKDFREGSEIPQHL
nr:hypothetical protein Iba_chr02dCG6110 [Ipomoea batatas]